MVYLADKLVQGGQEVSWRNALSEAASNARAAVRPWEHFERRRLQARRALQVESSIAI